MPDFIAEWPRLAAFLAFLLVLSIVFQVVRVL